MRLLQFSVLLTAAILTLISLQSCSRPAHALMGTGFSTGGWTARAGVDLGIGSMKNQSVIQSRTLWDIAPYVIPGYQFTWAMLGVSAEYRIRSQMTNVSSVGNTNLSGAGYLVGPALGFGFFGFHLIGSYDLLGQYKLAVKTSSGAELTYKKASGFRFMLGYQLYPLIGVSATYQMASYGKSLQGTTETDIASNKLQESMVRAGISISF